MFRIVANMVNLVLSERTRLINRKPDKEQALPAD